MKDNFLYRSIAFVMAFVMLFTSTGYAMDSHYCQGELKSVAFFAQAESCHQAEKMTECPHHQQMACHSNTQNDEPGISEDDCCQNETILVESDIDSVMLDFSDLTTHQVYFIATYVHVFINQYVSPKTTGKKYVLIKPPLPERDFQVLFASFLI